MIRRFINWVLSFFRKKEQFGPAPEVVVRELSIRRYIKKGGRHVATTERAALEAPTPKGAHVITRSGIRLHRKNRDILAA